MKGAFLLLLSLPFFLSLASSAHPAMAQDQQNCDSNNGFCCDSRICIEDAFPTAQGGQIALVILMDGTHMDLPNPPQLPELLIQNDGSVRFVDGSRSYVIGMASGSGQPTNPNYKLIPTDGFDLSMSSKPGEDISSCNDTAWGIIYEHTRYHTTDLTLTISRNGQTLDQIKSNQPAGSPFQSVALPIPCSL